MSFIRKLWGLGGLPLPDSKDNIMKEKCQILRLSNFITLKPTRNTLPYEYLLWLPQFHHQLMH